MENKYSFNSLVEQTIKSNWDKDALTDYKGATLQYHDVARKIEKLHIVFDECGIKVGDNLTIDSTGRLNATGGDLSGYYTKEETDEAIANAIGGLINANEVGY